MPRLPADALFAIFIPCSCVTDDVLQNRLMVASRAPGVPSACCLAPAQRAALPRRQQLREQGNQISLSIRYRASPGGSILEFQRKALRVAPVVAAATLERSSRAVRVVICYIQNGNLLQRIKARH